eukprot:CAMPEP_0204254614 /NCGR_PEP_ID=MMETSP0468-20130131/2652_1 /ASSEMBLY_ACC=CAM_ASM_000383 /TAXON_ID=2969 /ORGANISM="Oxyrrhis marina" /LENGTH=64 /DNA_ID=CAMNT_0051228367 /DNA_START=161 /DNA_END=355 /DNA_ORIENTATION=+
MRSIILVLLALAVPAEARRLGERAQPKLQLITELDVDPMRIQAGSGFAQELSSAARAAVAGPAK